MTNEERQIIRERLNKIAAANGGRLRPEDVVEDARSPDSPLHKFFDWDVHRAAMRHWLERAREIIGIVHVVVRTEEREVACPYWVRDPDVESGEQGYVAVVAIRSDKARAAQVVQYESERALACLQRARSVAAALGMRRMVDDAIANVERVVVQAARRQKTVKEKKRRVA